MSSKTYLEMKCPGSRCTNNSISQWRHNFCGGTIMIDERAYFSCDNCCITYIFYE